MSQEWARNFLAQYLDWVPEEGKQLRIVDAGISVRAIQREDNAHVVFDFTPDGSSAPEGMMTSCLKVYHLPDQGEDKKLVVDTGYLYFEKACELAKEHHSSWGEVFAS